MTYNSKVYRKRGGDELVVASGGTLTVEAGGTITGLSETLDLSAHLWAARELASGETLVAGTSDTHRGLLLDNTTPFIGLTSSGDQSAYLQWACANVDAIKLPPIALPKNLSTAGGLTISVRGESIGTGTASDAKAAVDVRCWINEGDTEMGATHPDFSSTPSWQDVAIASGNLATGAMLNITLVPQAHAGRALRVQGLRATYTRGT